MNNNSALTKTDLKLIRFLQKDPRNLSRLADNLGVNIGKLYYRIKKLEKKGILKGYMAKVDCEKLGYSLTAVLLAQIDCHYREDIEKKLADFSNITIIYDITGKYDMLIIARFRRPNILYNFIKQFQRWSGVKKILTNVALDVIKEDCRVLM